MYVLNYMKAKNFGFAASHKIRVNQQSLKLLMCP